MKRGVGQHIYFCKLRAIYLANQNSKGHVSRGGWMCVERQCIGKRGPADPLLRVGFISHTLTRCGQWVIVWPCVATTETAGHARGQNRVHTVSCYHHIHIHKQALGLGDRTIEPPLSIVAIYIFLLLKINVCQSAQSFWTTNVFTKCPSAILLLFTFLMGTFTVNALRRNRPTTKRFRIL